MDLSGDNNSNNQEDEARADELGKSRGRRTRAPATRGRRPSRSSAAGGKGGKEKERLAGMVASLEASLKNKKTTEVVKKNAPYARGGAAKRTVTKHSVINKIDLSKFQSVGAGVSHRSSGVVLYESCLLRGPFGGGFGVGVSLCVV